MGEKSKEDKGGATNNNEFTDFDWIQLKKDIASGQAAGHETERPGLRKLKENPLVPLGALATLGFLINGLRQFLKGNKMEQQKMMRGRVLGQGFTFLVVFAGLMYSAKTSEDRKKAVTTKVE